MWQGQGLPVVVTFGLQQGSLHAGVVLRRRCCEQLWAGLEQRAVVWIDECATVAGFSFGSAGYSGQGRAGPWGVVTSVDMTWRAVRARRRRWRSNSGVVCKLSAGSREAARTECRHGEGLPVVVTFGLQQGSLHAGVVLRRQLL
jgi:hypothetical protein